MTRIVFRHGFSISVALSASLLVSCSTSISFLDLNGEMRAADIGDYADRKVCISGIVSNDDLGVYFLLAPFEDSDGVIEPSPPRVQISTGGVGDPFHGLVNGQTYQMCGTLREAAPWQACDRDECGWYALERPRVGSGN